MTARLPATQWAALGVALLGLILIAVGVARTGGAAGGSASSTVRLTTEAATLVIGPERLDEGTSKVTVRATDAAGRAVFVGAARAEDVQAYLGGAPWAEVGAGGEISEHAGSGRLADPRAGDIWATLSTGTGTTALVWPATPGRWRLVAAGDGSARAPAVELTWSYPRRASGALWWWLGGLLMGTGLVGLGLLRGLIPVRPHGSTGVSIGGSTPAPAATPTPATTPAAELRESDQTRPIPRATEPGQMQSQPRTRAEALGRTRAAPPPPPPPPPVRSPPPAPAQAPDRPDEDEDDDTPAVLPFRSRPRRRQ